ncbi:MAG: stage II sporulation protein P, partial [Clostridia bacterium]|nr:stage II sporulation protein P [Clostridia bacterium]
QMTRTKRFASKNPHKKTYRWTRGLYAAALIAAIIAAAGALSDNVWAGLLRGVAGADIRSPQAVLESVFGRGLVLRAGEDEGPVILGEEAPPLDIRIVRPENPPALGSLNVLIYHTHTTEAFSRLPGETTSQNDWRSSDPKTSIVAVGTQMQQLLQAQGFNVIHALTNHEPPNLRTAYQRSILTMQAALDEGEVDLFIDVHRDAYAEPLHPVLIVDVNNTKAARMMFVVGTGEGADGTQYPDKPDWKRNLALATAITAHVNGNYPNMMNAPMLRTDRFNQHMGLCLLIEIGNNRNTLSEAMAAAGPLCEAIAACRGMMEQESGRATVSPPTPPPAQPTEEKPFDLVP